MNIDWNFAMANLPLYEKAAWIILELAFIGIPLSLVIGLICSIALNFKVKVIYVIV